MTTSQHTPEAADQAWEPVARSTRDALASLGYSIAPRCLPDEANACGATFAQHAMAHLGALKAIADHHLKHLGELGQAHGHVYWHVRDEIETDPACQMGPS
jgi:hypothetical protein